MALFEVSFLKIVIAKCYIYFWWILQYCLQVYTFDLYAVELIEICVLLKEKANNKLVEALGAT